MLRIDTLIEGDYVLTGEGTVYAPGFVALAGERVAALGAGAAPPALREGAARRVDAEGCAVHPGFVNAHTHLFQTFLRGLRDDLPLEGWLDAVIWPNALRFTEEDFYLAALLGAVENLKSGATTIVENHYVHTSPGNTDRVAEALVDSGIRAWLARGGMDRLDRIAAAVGPEAGAALAEPAGRYLAEVERTAARWHGAGGGRLHLALAAQTAFLCSPTLCEAVATYAADNHLLVHAHCAETRASVATCVAEQGRREVAYFAATGLLGTGMQLVHSVWLADDEVAQVAAARAAVVHCPVSNAYLASGVAPIPALRRAGVVLALGTDGPGSNNRQDSYESLKAAVNLQKVSRLDAAALSPADALQMAWGGGAAALGQQGRLGVLAPGALADIVIVSLTRPHLQPVHRVESALVFCATPGDVRDVFVGGHQVIAGGRCTTIDEVDLLRRCAERARALGLHASGQAAC